MTDQKIGISVFLLRALAIAVIAVQFGQAAMFFAWDDRLYLEVSDEIWIQHFWDLPGFEQAVMFALLLIPLGIIVAGAYQLIPLCGAFGRGEIFSAESVLRIHRFALASIGLAVSETVLLPVVVGFLYIRGILPGVPDISPLTLMAMVEFEIFMIGTLFFLIARVMRRGLEIQQDQALTI